LRRRERDGVILGCEPERNIIYLIGRSGGAEK